MDTCFTIGAAVIAMHAVRVATIALPVVRLYLRRYHLASHPSDELHCLPPTSGLQYLRACFWQRLKAVHSRSSVSSFTFAPLGHCCLAATAKMRLVVLLLCITALLVRKFEVMFALHTAEQAAAAS